MSDNMQPGNSPDGNEGPNSGSAFDAISPYLHPGKQNVLLIYVLYLVGMVPAFGLVPIIIGFVLALLNRSNATGIWASHYEYQFRQALVGLLYVVVSFILVFVLIGFLGLLATAIWWIVRSIKGIQAASNTQPIADPRSFAW